MLVLDISVFCCGCRLEHFFTGFCNNLIHQHIFVAVMGRFVCFVVGRVDFGDRIANSNRRLIFMTDRLITWMVFIGGHI